MEEHILVFMLDSTYFGLIPGTVTFTSITNIPFDNNLTSQHQPSLIYLIKLYKKSINGAVIGIEVEKIEFSIELSQSLKLKFNNICEEVYDFIVNTTIFSPDNTEKSIHK